MQFGSQITMHVSPLSLKPGMQASQTPGAEHFSQVSGQGRVHDPSVFKIYPCVQEVQIDGEEQF